MSGIELGLRMPVLGLKVLLLYSRGRLFLWKSGT